MTIGRKEVSFCNFQVNVINLWKENLALALLIAAVEQAATRRPNAIPGCQVTLQELQLKWRLNGEEALNVWTIDKLQ